MQVSKLPALTRSSHQSENLNLLRVSGECSERDLGVGRGWLSDEQFQNAGARGWAVDQTLSRPSNHIALTSMIGRLALTFTAAFEISNAETTSSESVVRRLDG
jgi:hypothetical protein